MNANRIMEKEEKNAFSRFSQRKVFQIFVQREDSYFVSQEITDGDSTTKGDC